MGIKKKKEFQEIEDNFKQSFFYGKLRLRVRSDLRYIISYWLHWNWMKQFFLKPIKSTYDLYFIYIWVFVCWLFSYVWVFTVHTHKKQKIIKCIIQWNWTLSPANMFFSCPLSPRTYNSCLGALGNTDIMTTQQLMEHGTPGARGRVFTSTDRAKHTAPGKKREHFALEHVHETSYLGKATLRITSFFFFF